MSSAKLSRSVDEQLRSAIAGKRLVQLRYSGSVRVVGPHDYGVKKGAAMLLAYQQQTSGPAKKSATGWRLFDVAKIAECVMLETPFKGSRAHPISTITTGTFSTRGSNEFHSQETRAPDFITTGFGLACKDKGFTEVWRDDWLWGHQVFRKPG